MYCQQMLLLMSRTKFTSIFSCAESLIIVPCVIAGCHEDEQDSSVDEMNRAVSEGTKQVKIMWIQEMNFHCVEKKMDLITDFLRSCN